MLWRILFLSLCGLTGLSVYWYVWPVDVDISVVTERTIAREIVAPGVLKANRQVMITAKTAGFLSAVNVDRNDVVRKGDNLASLDSAELTHLLAAAEANRKAALSMIKGAGIERDRAVEALTFAKSDFSRQKQLLQKNTISSAAFDSTSNSLQMAEAVVLKAESAIEQARAHEEAAAAEVAAVSSRLAETAIRSPIDGVVISRSKSLGDLLPPGAELFEIVDPSTIIVSARFDESTINLVRPGQHAELLFTVTDGTPLEGKVLRIAREVDQETREYEAEISLGRLPQNWAIGQRATVKVTTESGRPGIAVPQKLVTRENGRLAVWLLRDGRAKLARVELGYVNGAEIEIRKGLAMGDVILDPVGRYEWQAVRSRMSGP